MTREEASFILANIDRRVCDDELNDALDMAISALEQTETWNGYHGQITAPKGTFKKIWDDCEQEPCDTSTDEPMTMVYPTIFCDDAISRADAIGAIYKANDDGLLFDRVLNKIKALPSVTPSRRKGHWIPVSKRLPERNKRVIVCYETMEGIKVDTSMFDKYGCLLGKAVAWMPLPEPYKAESEEQTE